MASSNSNNVPDLYAMSIDVEDYYHAHAMEKCLPRSSWPSLERRVRENTDRILQTLDDKGVKATFFTLGSVGEEFPMLIKDIVDQGHELASHGWAHHRVTDFDKTQFREDVTRAKAVLEYIGGVPVIGYRAPSFSIEASNWWAFEILEETGHKYSSSVSSGRSESEYLVSTETPFQPTGNSLWECPISTVDIMGKKIPTGGGYYRLIPYSLSNSYLKKRQVSTAQPAIFYYHPWEIDAGIPCPSKSLKTRFKHLVNIRRMEQKVSRLLNDYQWAPMKDVFKGILTTPS